MDGAVVARAQAYDAERELPFAVLGELVKQLASQRAIGGADPEALSELTRISSEILRVFPGVPKPVEWSPELMPLRIADAFLKTVTAAAADNPVMLVVDDLHAADNASTAILHSVARKLSDTRVLMILTARTSELRLSGGPWAFPSDVSVGATRALDLDVLTQDAAQLLIGRLATPTTRSEPPVERVLRASGGNPLAIELLTREWTKHGSESLLCDLEALNTNPVPSLGIPRAIGAVFERQSSRLGTTTRATLDLGAILGRRIADLPLYAALDISPATAAECLSRLKEEGFLREVRGDLEFRNELIRAQAYYAVACVARSHLHRRIGDLLAARPITGDAAALALEIAWHYLRGASGECAIPFAHQGAEAFLAIGAPHEAEEVLKAVSNVNQSPSVRRHTHLLLANALLDQSKGEQALPLVNGLAADQEVSLNDQAEVAMLRASAEYLLNSEPGEKYCEVTQTALGYAKRTADPGLISRALFECARAGTEQGLLELLTVAEAGLKELRERVDISRIPVAVVTQAFCRMFRMNSAECLDDLQKAIRANSVTANAAQMAFIHSAMGMALLNLCRLNEAFNAYSTAFELSKKVGDDARMSMLASNVCAVQVARGLYEHAIKWGEMSVALGESSNSSALQMTYTNLVDAYVLVGNESAAVEFMDRARDWLVPKRRWKFHCGFLGVSAAFALIRGNTSLALDIIGHLEAFARDREEVLPMPGTYWKLRIFRSAHLGTPEEAQHLVRFSTALFRDVCPLHYLDILAAKAWLEIRTDGENSPETLRELCIFDEVGAVGRKALLTAQGFLKPLPSLGAKSGSALVATASVPLSRTPMHPQADGSRVIG
jgi:tetratricopeptide (TPR) repeat protein